MSDSKSATKVTALEKIEMAWSWKGRLENKLVDAKSEKDRNKIEKDILVINDIIRDLQNTIKLQEIFSWAAKNER